MTSSLRLSEWKSEKGRSAYRSAYDAALSLWPVPFDSRIVPTRFGPTHTLVSGPEGAPPMVLLPGATGAGAIQWYPNVEALSAGYRVHALDVVGAPGLGTQTAPIRERHDYASWLIDVLDDRGAESATVVASSQGGWMALALAIAAPRRVRRLALLAPAASLLPFRQWVAWGLRLGPHLPAATARPTIQANFGRRYRPDDRFVDLAATALRHFRYQQHAVRPAAYTDVELGSVTCPTLVMIGDREIIYEPGRALARATATMPLVETSLVEGAGHLPNMERSEEVDDRVLRFVTEVET